MKSRTLTCIIATPLFIALTIPAQLAAQHTRYKLIDIGTFGGPASYFTDPGIGPGSQVLSNRGMLAGKADTSTPDSSSNNCPPICFDTHVFRWDKGVLTDLGTLPGGNNSDVGGINARGWIAGGSETGETDPLTGGRVFHAVLWKGNELVDLGTLGGTTVAQDPGSCVNNRGQVAGASTLPGDSILHPFFWEHGVLTDLGTLGGDFGLVWWLNDAGDVVGGTSTAGEEFFHATLWRKGVIQDLGTLEGDCFSFAGAISSHDQIVGASFVCDGSFARAVTWDKGSIVDLNSVIPENSNLQLVEARYINNQGEIAGRGLPHGCHDLDGCGHDFLLIPCDNTTTCESDTGATTAETRNNAVVMTKTPSIPTPIHRTPMQRLAAWRAQLEQRLSPSWRARMAQRYHMPGLGAPKD